MSVLLSVPVHTQRCGLAAGDRVSFRGDGIGELLSGHFINADLLYVDYLDW